MFKVNNKDTRTTPVSSVSSVSIVNFEQVNAGCVMVSFVPILCTKRFYEQMFFKISYIKWC